MRVLGMLSMLFVAQAQTPNEWIQGPAATASAEAARQFIDAMQEGDAAGLAAQGTDPFTFEGRRLEGRAVIETFWKQALEAGGQRFGNQAGARVDVMSHESATTRFGKPPAKLSHLPLERCLFAAVTFERRHGYLLILVESPKNTWRVTAVTD